MAQQRRFGLVLVLLLIAAAAGASDQKAPADNALAWLKGLVGSWQGKLEWSGGRTGTGEYSAVYSLTGNGSAVAESLIAEGVSTMTSVYHTDGADLRMTHFCGAGNQPRLKATLIDESKKVVHFKMVDITGRTDHGNVDEVELRFLDENHLTILFTFVGGARPSIERIDLARVGK